MKNIKYLILLIIMFIPCMVFADLAAPAQMSYTVEVTSDNAYFYEQDYDSETDELSYYKTDVVAPKGTSLEVTYEEYHTIDKEKKLLLFVTYKNKAYYILNDDVKVTKYENINDLVYNVDYTYCALAGEAYLFDNPSLSSDKVKNSTVDENKCLETSKMTEEFAEVELDNGVSGWLFVGDRNESPYDNTLIVRKNTDNNRSILFHRTTYVTTEELIAINHSRVQMFDITSLDIKVNTIVKPIYYYGDYAFVEYNGKSAWMRAGDTSATINQDDAMCYKSTQTLNLYKYVDDEETTTTLSEGSLYTELAYGKDVENGYAYIYVDELDDYYWINYGDLTIPEESDECVLPPLFSEISSEDPVSDEPTSEVDNDKDLIQKIIIGVCVLVLVVLIILIIINRIKSRDDKKDSLKQINEEIEKTQSIPVIKEEEVVSKEDKNEEEK